MLRRHLLTAALGAVAAPVVASEPLVVELRVEADDTGFTIEQWSNGRLLASERSNFDTLVETHNGETFVSTRAVNGVRFWERM